MVNKCQFCSKNNINTLFSTIYPKNLITIYNLLSVCLSVCIFSISPRRFRIQGLNFQGGVVYGKFGEDQSKAPPIGLKKAKNGILTRKNYGATGVKLGTYTQLDSGVTWGGSHFLCLCQTKKEPKMVLMPNNF